jgi:ActR/RegA family two-component response regulator
MAVSVSYGVGCARVHADALFVREPSGRSAPPSLRRVLLVDDDVATLETWALLLAAEGVAVEVAPGVEACLRLVHERVFDLMVIDLQLEAENGLDVVRRLRERGHTVPFILATGHASVAVAVEAMRLGARTVLEKPLIGDDFLAPVLRELQALAAARADRALGRSAAQRWADLVWRGAQATQDPRTLADWARQAAVSRSVLVEACVLCEIQPKEARDFMRLLRLVLLRTPLRGHPEAWLDVADRRTARKLLERGGFQDHRPTLQQYLQGQAFVAKENPGMVALRALLRRHPQ